MAKCQVCLQEMMTGTSCLSALADWPRVDRWGDDPEWGNAACCPDCNCPKGGYHHVGCDVERCGHGRQAISCQECEECPGWATT